MTQAITKHAVFEHFAGRITPLQRQTLEAWLRQPANQQQYYAWLMEWEWQNLQYDADEGVALQRSLSQLRDKQLPSQPDVAPEPVAARLPQRPFWRSGWAIAASVLLVLLGSYAARPLWQYRTVETAYGQVRRLTLPDGSVVTLNANSSLRYPRFGFGTATRQVSLRGEAYFSVTHQPNKQRFVVQTDGGLSVVVLGTEFNLYARSQQTRVTLRRGRVRLVEVVNDKPRSLLMAPGDLVTRDNRGRWAQQRTPRPELQSAWQQQRFAFDRTALTDVARLIEDTYGLHVVLTDPALTHRTVSGTFRAENATEFLSTIVQLLDINYRQEGQTITFID